MNFSQNLLIAHSQMWACCCCNGGCWNAVQQGRERHWDGFGWWNLEKRSEQPPWNLQKYDEISLLQLISDYIDHFSWTNFHDWNFMGPRRMAAEEAVEHPYFQEAQGSIKRLPYNVGLTGASSFFSSKCPWALGSSMDPCNMNLYESYAEAEWGGRIDISRMLSTYRISCLIFSERFLPFWSPFWLQS